MGYETKLIFVINYRKGFKGYCSTVATLDMGKICYGEIGNLINKTRAKMTEKKKDEICKEAYAIDEAYNECYDRNGGLTTALREMPKEEQEKKTNKLFSDLYNLEEKLP